MDISYLDFFLINTLSFIGGVSSGILICCKYKNFFIGESNSSNTRELDAFDTPQIPYSPPPQAEVIATAPPPEQLNKGIRIVLE